MFAFILSFIIYITFFFLSNFQLIKKFFKYVEIIIRYLKISYQRNKYQKKIARLYKKNKIYIIKSWMLILSLVILLIPVISITLTIKFSLENDHYENIFLLQNKQDSYIFLIQLFKNIIKRLIDVTSALIAFLAIIGRYKSFRKYMFIIVNWINKKVTNVLYSIFTSIISTIKKIALLTVLLVCSYFIVPGYDEILYNAYSNLENQLILLYSVFDKIYKIQPSLFYISIIIILSPFIILLFIKFIVSMNYRLIIFIVSSLYLFKYIGFLGF